MISPLEKSLVSRFGGSAPRYTSYPTAPHFHAGVSTETYVNWLERLGKSASLSLYAHIPFCGTLCWFCACRSQGARLYAPIERYLGFLEREAETVGSIVADRPVRSVHWGGGSPTILAPRDLKRLAEILRTRFAIAPDAEFAVEIDARDMTEERIDALADAGLTRASLGVQDFDPEVQKAINRRQSFEKTRQVIEGLRARGVGSVNIDALYGLPYQTADRIARTIGQVIALAPDRVALFGYAHVPWMAKRQQLIPDDALPDSVERFEQASMAAEQLTAAGYVRVGLDHFAKPGDTLAEAAQRGELRRNFQGYTVDQADALIGLGASAIGRLPQGFVQNAPSTARYQEQVDEHGLAISRGLRFSAEDRVRSDAIERLMCDLAFDRDGLRARHGDFALAVIREEKRVVDSMPDGVLEPTETGFRVTETGRPFVRNVAAAFDAYLRKDDETRYSRAV